MNKHLQNTAEKPVSGYSKRSHQGLPRRSARRAKAGWSPERRARQAALIRNWSPWRRSTGPKTDAGKARCAANALKHGYRSQQRIELMRRVRHVLRLAERNVKLLRLHIRTRNARPRIKYKFPPPPARASLLSSGLRARLERLSSPASVGGPPAGRVGGDAFVSPS